MAKKPKKMSIRDFMKKNLREQGFKVKRSVDFDFIAERENRTYGIEITPL